MIFRVTSKMERDVPCGGGVQIAIGMTAVASPHSSFERHPTVQASFNIVTTDRNVAGKFVIGTTYAFDLGVQ